MEGKEVFKHAVGMVTDVIKACFEDAGVTAADIDWFVPHQANRRIIDASADKLGIPREKVVVTVDRHGNTSAASIPLALDVARRGRPHQARRSGDDRGDGRRLYLGRGAGPLVKPGGVRTQCSKGFEALLALVVGYVQFGASERRAGGFSVMAGLVPRLSGTVCA